MIEMDSFPSFGVDERILSIVLSRSELAELDLSKLQLFRSANGNEAEAVIYKSRGAIEAEKEKKKKEASMEQTANNSPPEEEKTATLGIDLKSSQASKFLVPWELQLSPLRPFTPAAVPFKWEEEPGKPKKRAPEMVDRRSQALHLPPRLLLSQRSTHPQSPPEEKRVICVQPAEKFPVDRSPGRLISSLDCQLGNFSPLRALGPPPPEDLHWAAKASALITMWRKNSSKLKHPPTHNDKMKNKSFNPSEHLIDEKERKLWVDEATKTAQSLNAVIAVAMGAKTGDFNSCSEITGSYAYLPNLVDSKRRKRRRRWVLRKLRRPARVFKTFFRAVWKAVCMGKARHRSRGNQRLSYKSLRS